MNKQDKRYIFGCGGVGGWFEITTTNEKEATKIFMDALNAHPDIYCDWVNLDGICAPELQEDES